MIISRPEIIAKINLFSLQKEFFVFAIDFNGEKGFVLSSEEADKYGIKYDFTGGENNRKKRGKKSLKFDFFPVEYPAYEKAYKNVLFHLKRGDSYLVNLTCQSELKSNLSLAEIYDISNAPCKLFVPGHFITFSPEAFVHIGDSRISCCPMKGTIDAAIPFAVQKLLADEKELYEHNTIVDLIRNDLSMVSTNVKVKRFRYTGLLNFPTPAGDCNQQSWSDYPNPAARQA